MTSPTAAASDNITTGAEVFVISRSLKIDESGCENVRFCVTVPLKRVRCVPPATKLLPPAGKGPAVPVCVKSPLRSSTPALMSVPAAAAPLNTVLPSTTTESAADCIRSRANCRPRRRGRRPPRVSAR
jgi:hypothetical protein